MLIFINIISKKETFYNYIHLWYHLSINKDELFESQGNIKTYREEIIMMLTKRIQNIKPAATLALTGKVAELRKQGIDVIAFNLGEPDFGTPQNICDAAKAAIDAQKTKYTVVSGIMDLKEAICAKFLKDNNVVYKPNEICVGTGAKQPLVNAVLALCEEGDEVIIPTPCWVSYIEMVKLSGATPVLVQNREEDGFALNVEGIKKAITPKTKAIMINTPNNPTGAVYTKEQLTELAELACKHDFYIISDEVYEKLIYEGKKHFCVASISEEVKDRTVVINGVSKAYSMTGWRVGYAAGNAALIKGMTSLQGHTTSNTCSIAQYAALEAISGPQDSVESMRVEFDKRRKFLVERLNSMDGITCNNADGAFYLMPNMTAFYDKEWNGKKIADSFGMADYLLAEAKIAVVPGGAFESPDNIRIAYSNSMESLIEGMNRMEAALKKLG